MCGPVVAYQGEKHTVVVQAELEWSGMIKGPAEGVGAGTGM